MENFQKVIVLLLLVTGVMFTVPISAQNTDMTGENIISPPPTPAMGLTLDVEEWTTELKPDGSLLFGYVNVTVKGSTGGNQVFIRTHGDGLIYDHELILDAQKNFSNTVQIMFTHMATPRPPFTVSTIIIVKSGTYEETYDIVSPPLQYPFVNIALGKPAYASSCYSNAYPATNVVDGNPATVWGSAVKDKSQWLFIDLGQICDINGAEIHWYSQYFAKQYSIGISSDGKSWSMVMNKTSNGGIDYISGKASCRYIGILLKEPNSIAYGITEFKILQQ